MLPDWHHIGLDLPGQDGSDLIDPESNLIKQAERILLLCRELEIRHVVALSFGTITGLQLLIQQPRFFSTAVFGGPAIAGGPRLSKYVYALPNDGSDTGRTDFLSFAAPLG